MRTTPCDCLAAGWCERHQCVKSERLFQLCRRNGDLFRAWEDGQGPGQSVASDEGPPPSTEMPGLARRIANLGTAVVRHAMSGFQRVTHEVRDARLAICRGCPACDLARMICRENACGCYLQTKTSWASESCPRGYWQAMQPDQEEQVSSDSFTPAPRSTDALVRGRHAADDHTEPGKQRDHQKKEMSEDSS